MKAYLSKRDLYFQTRTPIPGMTGSERYLQQMTNSIDERPDIHVDSNDYLCMNQVALHNVDSKELLMSGIYLKEDSTHGKVTEAMAKYVGMRAAHISQSGYTANVSILQGLCDKNTPVYIDEKTHASFWDGIRTSGARGIVFKHNDMKDLQVRIDEYGTGVIIVDSLYSAHGTIAPLAELVQIKKVGNHILIVDESHSLGLYGEKGRGLCNRFKITKDVDFITASLSKAFSTRAGLIVAHDPYDIFFIKEVSFPTIFSSVISLTDVTKIYETLQEIQSPLSDNKRKHLMDISQYVRIKLENNFSVVQTLEPSPIICLVLRDEEELRRFQYYLQRNGIFGASFIKPAVNKKQPCVRLTLHSGLSKNDCDRIIETVLSYKLELYSSL